MLQQVKRYLMALEKILVVSSLFLLLVFSLVQIIARNFFETGFPALEVISRHLVLYIAFLGAALITEDQKHIKIDFLTHFFNQHQKDMMLRPLAIFAAMVCSVFAWHATRFWLDEWHFSSSQDSWIALLALILPVGFGLIALHFVLLAVTGNTPTPGQPE